MRYGWLLADTRPYPFSTRGITYIIISSTVILAADWSIAVGYWIVFHCFSLNVNARIRISVLSSLSVFYPTSPWQLWVWPQVYRSQPRFELDDEKENGGHSSSHRRLTRFFFRLKHYLRMLVCQHGVYMEIKMAAVGMLFIHKRNNFRLVGVRSDENLRCYIACRTRVWQPLFFIFFVTNRSNLPSKLGKPFGALSCV